MSDWGDDEVLYPPQPPRVETDWFVATPKDPDQPEDSEEHSEEYLRGYRDGIVRGQMDALDGVASTWREYRSGGIELDGRQGMG